MGVIIIMPTQPLKWDSIPKYKIAIPYYITSKRLINITVGWYTETS